MLPLDEPNRPDDLEVLPEVYALLTSPLSDLDPAVLLQELTTAQSIQAKVAVEHHHNARFLAQLRQQHLPPRVDRSMTDLDRQIQLAARTRDVQCVTDILADYAELLKTRIQVCTLLIETLQ